MAKTPVINAQLDRIAQALENLPDNAANAATLDATFGAMLDGTNTTAIFWQWWPLSAANGDNKYKRLCRFADMCANAWQDKVYTLRSYHDSVSGATAMTPMADLTGKTAAQLCLETTEPVTDWADEDPMTWYIRGQALSLADGTMNITALEGEEGFDITGEAAPVWTFALSLWVNDYTDGQYNYKTFATVQKPGLYPMPGDVGPDNKKRPITWHPTFPGGLNSAGALTSGAGRKPYIDASANAGNTAAKKMDAYEGLWNDCDTNWLLCMWQLRHFDLENSGILEGCLNYYYNNHAALAEENTRRVLVTAGQGTRYVVGSCVSVGTMNGDPAAGSHAAGYHDIAHLVQIGSIEQVEIDGTTYDAINLVLDAPITIPDTAAQICTMPYYSGDTEAVPGHKDGCRASLTAGKTPIRVAGVEVIDGAYTLGLDPLYNVAWDSENSKATYTVYECRDSEKLAGSITANYTETGIVSDAWTSSWHYVKSFVRNRLGVLFPEHLDGASNTYFKSAFCVAGSAGVRCPWRFVYLAGGGACGLAGGNGYSPGYVGWLGRPRLSGAGKKRGEWAA